MHYCERACVCTRAHNTGATVTVRASQGRAAVQGSAAILLLEVTLCSAASLLPQHLLFFGERAPWRCKSHHRGPGGGGHYTGTQEGRK